MKSNKKNKNVRKDKSDTKGKFNKLLVLLIVSVTTIVYYDSLNNQFLTSWDDNTYVTDNNTIKSFHGDSINYTIRKIFSTNVAGNYHPLTMLSYCLEYSKFKLDPRPYHITNLILHLLNSIFVFLFVWWLTRQQWVAFITSLLFAIHPMHVESVAWVSERKDVLYSLFYLSALCVYLKYIEAKNNRVFLYLLLLLLFLGGIFSKAMIVTLPVIFFLIDYFKGRKITWKNSLEKLPFILVSIGVGYLAIVAQKNSSTMEDLQTYNFFDRFLFASYGFTMYLGKLILPVNLNNLYGYPIKLGGSYPAIFYITPFIILAIAFLVYYSKRLGKDLIFGFLFFVITVALVIQIIPVGAAIIADRYTYIPYIGLFFIVGRFANRILENKSIPNNSFKVVSVITLVVVSGLFSYGSYQRTKIWKSNYTLWGDSIGKDPMNPIAYNARGGAYYLEKQFDPAIADFSSALNLKSDFGMPRYNRGLAYFFTNKYEEAVADFTIAIKSGPKFYKAYSERGNAYVALGKMDLAFNDFNTAIEKIPDYVPTYINRGVAYGKIGKYRESIDDFSEAIRIDPRYDEAYFDRGISFFRIGKYEEAMNDLLRARDLGYYVDPSYFETVQAEINKAKR